MENKKPLTAFQFEFTGNVVKLLYYANNLGFNISLGEVYRTAEQQEYYVKNGKSKTYNSQHRKRLAIDINLFKGSEYLTSKEHYKALAVFWQDLSPYNVAGYFWGWDANHFEMRIKKRSA